MSKFFLMLLSFVVVMQSRAVEISLPRVIVIDKDATDPAREGALVLQKYLQMITGRPFAIVDKSNAPAIFVGESEYTRKAGLTNDSFKSQEYLIKSDNGNLILMGRDQSNAENAKLKGNSFNANKYFQEIGTIYAINDFLEKYCQVRWYMPGAIGEVVPHTSDLRLPDNINIRRVPCTKFRSLFGYSNIPEKLYLWKYDLPNRPDKPFLADDLQLAWGRQLKMGGMPFAANHNQYDYYTRFKDRKDFFANGNPQSGNQLCLANPDVKRQVVQDARDFFDGKYAGCWNIGNFFAVMPADTKVWCECEKCRVFYDSKYDVKSFHNGSKSRYVWSFIADVAKELAKTHPGKYISCCAYWDYRDYPDGVEIPSNVAVMLTKSYYQYADSALCQKEWQEVAKWRKHTKEIYFWDYYLMPTYPAFDRFPPVSPLPVAEDIMRMKKLDITGGMMCQLDEWFWRNVVLDHLRVYVTMKLLDDWNQEPQAIVDEYYRLFYGPAETPMREYWEMLDSLFRKRPIIETSAETDWTVVCPPEKIKKMAELLDKALELAPANSVYAKRVNLIRNGIHDSVICANSKRVLAIMQNLRHANCPWIDKAPKLDGRLSDPAWNKAALLSDFTSVSGEKAYVATKVKLMRDNNNLYVGFECFDMLDYKVVTNCKERDGQIYLDDSVEIFIQPDSDKEYIQLVANAAGVLFDACNKNFKWNSDAQVATAVETGRWTAEFSIPLCKLQALPVKPGTVWRMNFCRNRRNLPGFVSPYMNWSGPSGYHNPQRYGKITLN